jgi:hypothetical protein
MTDKELMQMALDALIDAADSQNWEMQQNIDQHGEWYRRSLYLKQATTNSQEAIKALRAQLAQPEPEPVAWVWTVNSGAGYITRGVGFDKADIPFAKHTPLYAAPPQREWQGLTDDEILEEYRQSYGDDGDLTDVYFARAIEAKLKEKNT